MLRSKKIVCFFFLFLIICTIPTIVDVLSETQQMDVTDIAITGIVDNTSSIIIVNSEDEVYTGVIGPGIHLNSTSFEKLSLPLEISLNTRFQNPYSASDGQNNMVVFLKDYHIVNRSYLMHYSDDTLLGHVVLNFENKGEQLFYTDGFFYLAYHNNTSFQIDRINTVNMTLTNVFDSNKVINYTSGESFLVDLSIYFNAVALGIEYQDQTLNDNNTSAFYLLNFQRESIIIQDFALLEPNSIEQISVFNHKVLIWGEQTVSLRDTNEKIMKNLVINGTYEYEMAIEANMLDIVLYSENAFILINERFMQLWIIEYDDLANYQFGIDNTLFDKTRSKILVDDLGNLFFAYRDEYSEIISLKLYAEEFMHVMGDGITYTYPFFETSTSSIPTNEMLALLVIIGLAGFSLVIVYNGIIRGKKENYQTTTRHQDVYQQQENLIAPKLLKTLCPNCNAKREESDVFCSECGHVL
ncbi:MAG: zinc ribbon domain-containing protein [Candidatus Hodarchaeales archaeon]